MLPALPVVMTLVVEWMQRHRYCWCKFQDIDLVGYRGSRLVALGRRHSLEFGSLQRVLLRGEVTDNNNSSIYSAPCSQSLKCRG